MERPLPQARARRVAAGRCSIRDGARAVAARARVPPAGQRGRGDVRARGCARDVRAPRREAGRGERERAPREAPDAPNLRLHRHRRLDEAARDARRTRSGSDCSRATTSSCASGSSTRAARSSSAPATASSQPSTTRRQRSRPRLRSSVRSTPRSSRPM